MTVSLNTANPEELEFLYLATDVASYIEMPTIPADGLGHKITLTLNRRPHNPGEPETNWTKSVLANGFATSRAQCLCIVVASPRLFEAECRTPRQMQLANAFCRYFELATPL